MLIETAAAEQRPAGQAPRGDQRARRQIQPPPASVTIRHPTGSIGDEDQSADQSRGGATGSDPKDNTSDSEKRSRHEERLGDIPSPKKRRITNPSILLSHNVQFIDELTHPAVKVLRNQLQMLRNLNYSFDRMGFFSSVAKDQMQWYLEVDDLNELNDYSDKQFFAMLLNRLSTYPWESILHWVADIHLIVSFNDSYLDEFFKRITCALDDRGKHISNLTEKENAMLIDHYQKSLRTQMGNTRDPDRPDIQKHTEFIVQQLENPDLPNLSITAEQPKTFYKWLRRLQALLECVQRAVRIVERSHYPINGMDGNGTDGYKPPRDLCGGCGKAHSGDRSTCHFISHPDFNDDPLKTWMQSTKGQAYAQLNVTSLQRSKRLSMDQQKLINMPKI